MSRRHSSAAVTVWRTNRTDTNRGRAVLVAEAEAIYSVANERNIGNGTERVSVTVLDSDTGARFTLKVTPVEWLSVVNRVARLCSQSAQVSK